MRHASHTHRSGFTLIEIVVVIGLLLVIIAIASGGMKQLEAVAALKVSTDEIYRAFTDSRNRTLASENDQVYGVVVSTTSVTRFVGSTYSATSTTNEVFLFPRDVTVSGALVTPPTPVVFARLTGEPSAIGEIVIQENLNYATNSVVIYASGLVEY